jgi:hypothetical protein
MQHRLPAAICATLLALAPLGAAHAVAPLQQSAFTIDLGADAGATAAADPRAMLLASGPPTSRRGVLPEPAVWTTMMAGFAFLGLALRRRRDSAEPEA